MISYIIATFNCGNRTEVLADTVSSLSGLPIEFLIADGGSHDGTAQRLNRLPGVKLVCSEPDRGIYSAWNRALPSASGQYIGFLGIDDRPSRTFVEEVLRIAQSGPPLPAVIYGKGVMTFNGRQRIRKPVAHPKVFFSDRPQLDISHQGLLHHRDLFAGEQFDESFRLAGDLELLIRLRSTVKAMGIVELDHVQVTAPADGVSRSPDAERTYRREFDRITAKAGLRPGRSRARSYLIQLVGYLGPVFSVIKSLSWKLRSTPEES